MRKSTRILFIVGVIFFWASTLGAQMNIDSAEVETKIRAAGTLRFTSIDSSLHLGKQALLAARELGDERVLAKAEYQLAVIFIDGGQLDSALQHGVDALRQMRSVEWDFGEILTLNLLGTVHRSKNDFQPALDYLQQSLNKAVEIEDSISIAYALSNIGNVYFDGGENDKAKEYYEDGLAVARLLRDDDPYILNNLLTNLSNVVAAERRYELLLESENLSREIADSSNLVFVWNNLAGYHRTLAEGSDSVRHYYLKSFTAAEQLGDWPSGIAAANGLTQWFLHHQEYDRAKVWLDWALRNGQVYGSNISRIESYKNAALYWGALGQFARTIPYKDSVIQLQEEVYKAEKAEALAIAYQRYELAKKDLAISRKDLALTREKQRRTRLWGGVIGLLLLSTLLLLWLRSRTIAARQKVALRTQEMQYWQGLHNFKAQTFADISHDLRHPLSLIIGPVQQLKQQLLDSPSQRLIQLIANNANSLLVRTNNLLDLARLEAGQLPVRSRPVALLPFLRRTILAYQSLAETKQVQIEFTCQVAEDEVLQIDADKVEKILQNLMSNAIKYSPADSAIQFSVGQQAGRLRLKVSDQGPGVTTDHGELIFQRFGATDETQKHSVGIGLALSRQLARQMDGELELLNTSPAGASFLLTLPWTPGELVVGNLSTQPEKKEPVIIPEPLPEGKILLVEDQKDMREYLEQLLQEHYKVITASNGAEALKLLQKQQVELILSDISMPGMDGLTLREKVKNDDRWSKIPFVFLTARALDEQQLQGLVLGVDDYLVKPFLPEELLVRLGNLYRNTLARRSIAPEFQQQESASEMQFRKAHKIASEQIHEFGFNVQQWASSTGLSTRQLRRIIQEQSHLNAVQYLLELRLQKAYRLISQRSHFTVAEIAYECGIESLSYFSRKFQERFGVKASVLLRTDT